MKKEGNINFYNVFIEFYKFSVTDAAKAGYENDEDCIEGC